MANLLAVAVDWKDYFVDLSTVVAAACLVCYFVAQLADFVEYLYCLTAPQDVAAAAAV